MNNIEECVNSNKCMGCGNCSFVCKVKAITMTYNEEGFLFPKVNSKCVNCGLCRTKCPAMVSNTESKVIGAYGFSSSDNRVLNNSASGGIAYSIASSFCGDNGYVCGCVYDSDNSVRHIVTNCLNDIIRMNSSKYVQSDLKDSFLIIRSLLEADKRVLFIGTPCQASALRVFIDKEYKNLYIIDLVCHGVPSPKLLSVYIDYLQRIEKCTISDLNFRYKHKGKWEYIFSYVRDADNRRVVRYLSDDKYGADFLKGINYRESCYMCQYSSINNRPGDLTIGDFWGVRDTYPQNYNSHGTSSVIINNIKGVDLINKYTNEEERFICDSEDIIKNQTNLRKPTERPIEREFYYSNFDESFFDKKKSPKSFRKTIIRLIPRKLLQLLIKIKKYIADT